MPELDRHYTDPRLVALYDAANPRGADTAFYLDLAAALNARRIVDLGCGTGLLTRALAEVEGRAVLGADPSPAMLAHARAQPGAERVHWIEGTSRALGAPGADLALMTGNVAQVFLDDADWAATLRDLHAALRPGGHLAFETRNPAAREWEGWTREETQTVTDTPHGPLEEWVDGVRQDGSFVHFEAHNVFLSTGEVVVIPSTLRFRDTGELHASLAAAGFATEHVYGDWQRGPVTDQSRVLVIVARRP